MAKRIILTVHGIRTFGQWQERLEIAVFQKAANEHDHIEFQHYKYGYFSIFAFVVPVFRWFVTRRFRKHLERILDDKTVSRIDIVAHSFGTHIVGWGLWYLRNQYAQKVHTVILAGSVLKSSFGTVKLLNTPVTMR